MPDDLPLPRWVYVPGAGGAADRESLDRVKALVPARFDQAMPPDHPALTYGLALNDAGFFWECHEILEAVWKAAAQGGRDRILLRACIQIANANLKQAMGQPRAVQRLLGEALAELDELARRRTSQQASGFADVFPVFAVRERLGQAMPVTAIKLRPDKGT
jgi:Domain of unknown function (DUF309)